MTAALNLLLFLIFVALVVAVFRPTPKEPRVPSPPRLWAAFLIGLASSVIGYLLTGLESWGHFHLSVYGALAITFAAAVVLARSSPHPIGYSPIALAGYLGIVGIALVGYALLALLCAGAGGCHTS